VSAHTSVTAPSTTIGSPSALSRPRYRPGKTWDSGSRWFGGAPGEAPAFYHSWLLKPDGNGCRAIMDEAGVGPGAAAFREADEGRMHRGHALWLATLEWVSEGR